MKDPNRKVIYLLWTVVAVVIVGSAVAGFMLIHKADSLAETNLELTGDVASLREQLRQAKAAQPTPSETPAATPTPTVTPIPAISGSPTPTPSSRP